MPYYDRIDVSEGTDINKTRELKECDIFHSDYFLDNGFMSQMDTFINDVYEP